MSALAFVHSRLNAFFGSPYFCMMFLLMFSLSTLELLPVLQASTAFAGLLAQRCSRTALQAQEAGHNMNPGKSNMFSQDSSPAVGLDVGTTNSAVAVRRADGRFLVVPPPGQVSRKRQLRGTVGWRPSLLWLEGGHRY